MPQPVRLVVVVLLVGGTLAPEPVDTDPQVLMSRDALISERSEFVRYRKVPDSHR
jgi:hypothetical protein